jgi:hypothetical protein
MDFVMMFSSRNFGAARAPQNENDAANPVHPKVPKLFRAHRLWCDAAIAADDPATDAATAGPGLTHQELRRADHYEASSG